jgi:phage internal scaffolding protein
MPKVYSLFDPPPPVYAEIGSGGADQSFADEADINNIIAQYARTGYLVDPSVQATREALFLDMSTAPEDFFTAQTQLVELQDHFAQLPARVRERFGNNAAAILSFLSDADNAEEAVKLGLIGPLNKRGGEVPAAPAGSSPPLTPTTPPKQGV